MTVEEVSELLFDSKYSKYIEDKKRSTGKIRHRLKKKKRTIKRRFDTAQKVGSFLKSRSRDGQ